MKINLIELCIVRQFAQNLNQCEMNTLKLPNGPHCLTDIVNEKGRQ